MPIEELRIVLKAVRSAGCRYWLDGGWHEFPRSFFTVGRLGTVTVPCVSAEAQRVFHSGYDLREVDPYDMALLEALGNPGPNGEGDGLER